MFAFTDVEPFLIATVAQQLGSDAEKFGKVKDSAIEIIKTYVTLDVELPLDTRLLLPAAWLMGYIYIQTYETIAEVDQARFKMMYDNAVKMLERKKAESIYKVGEIEGLF